MIAAADDADPEVDHRLAGEDAPLHRLGDAGLDRGSVLLGDLVDRCAVLVDVPAPTVGGLDHEADVAVLAAHAGGGGARAVELVLALAAPGDGLTVGDLGVADAG